MCTAANSSAVIRTPNRGSMAPRKRTSSATPAVSPRKTTAGTVLNWLKSMVLTLLTCLCEAGAMRFPTASIPVAIPMNAGIASRATNHQRACFGGTRPRRCTVSGRERRANRPTPMKAIRTRGASWAIMSTEVIGGIPWGGPPKTNGNCRARKINKSTATAWASGELVVRPNARAILVHIQRGSGIVGIPQRIPRLITGSGVKRTALLIIALRGREVEALTDRHVVRQEIARDRFRYRGVA